ncbi:MAG: hypothetical protein AAB941_00990 [Patescibacteria group bacterium]
MKIIKEELFFIKETLRYGYGWSGVFKYLINKFWNSKLIYKLKLPEHKSVENVEIHMLCQKKDADMLAWSLMSFINTSGICPRVVVHDDGSFDQGTKKKLEDKFPELRVLSLEKADKLINNMTGLSPKLLEHRNHGHKLIYKLVDIFLLSRTEKVMVLDSDVLFFNRPEEILKFINENPDCDSLISRHDGSCDLMLLPDYSTKHDILKNEAGYMNSGIIFYKKDKIGDDKLLEYFENTLREPGDYFVEMTGWASLIAQTKFKFLTKERYVVKGRPETNTVAKHFTSPRRHEFYIYGIDMVRKGILEHE